jgi:hypothetical protein
MDLSGSSGGLVFERPGSGVFDGEIAILKVGG